MAAPIIDGFDEIAEIGRGGTGVVYSARALADGRVVAIKILHVPLGEPGAARRFERELDALSRFAHLGGVVEVLGCVETADGRPGIVMDRMVESAGDRLRREGPWSVDDAVTVGVVVARTLERLHRGGVFHRDIKPANLLIGGQGEVAISDFDIAVVADGSTTTATLDSMSPPHAPPERLSGRGDGGAAGDIWSLGSTLFTLLEGHPPFGTAEEPGGLNALITRVMSSPLPPSRRTDVSRHLWAVLEVAMAKSPSERFATAGDFADALDAVATSPTDALRAVAASPRRRWLSSALVAAGTLGAVGAGVWLMVG